MARIVVIDAFAAQTAREEIRGAFFGSALEARQEVARCGQVIELSRIASA